MSDEPMLTIYELKGGYLPMVRGDVNPDTLVDLIVELAGVLEQSWYLDTKIVLEQALQRVKEDTLG